MLPPRNERLSFSKIDGSKQSESSLASLNKDELNCSIDSESTTSTYLDSFSKASSDASLEVFEIDTPPNFRNRLSINIDRVQPITWLVDKPLARHPHFRSYKGREKRRTLPLWSYYTFGFIATALLLTVKRMTSETSEDASQYNAWQFFLKRQAPLLLQQIGEDDPGDSFTILLKGSRLSFVQQSVDAYRMCSSVKELQVDFGSKQVPATILALSDKVSVVGAVETSGVFLVSENVIISCGDLEKAFQSWKNDPIRMVGFFGFQQVNGDGFNLRGANLSTSDFQPVATGLAPYSSVSDRAVFVHNHYINSIPFYDYQSSCCELLLSLQISAISGEVPALIKANPRELSNVNLFSDFFANSKVATDEEDTISCFGNCMPGWLQVDLSDGTTTIF